MVLFEAPENIDMVLCLKDIAAMYAADEQDVPKVRFNSLFHFRDQIVMHGIHMKGVKEWMWLSMCRLLM